MTAYCNTIARQREKLLSLIKGVNEIMTSKVRIRLLCLLLCLAVLTPCVSALGETTKVAAYLLRLRESPSTSAKVLDAYPRGTVVTILKKGDSWTKVRVHGKEGYMVTSMLAYGRNASSSASSNKEQKTASKTSESSAAADGTTAYVLKGYRVNLRAEKNSSSEILGSYRGGTKVTVLKKGRYWSYVDVKGQVGYMWTDYLAFDQE